MNAINTMLFENTKKDLEKQSLQHPDIKVDNRVELAEWRTFLANERTWLAWVRTALAIAGIGLVLEKFEVFINSIHQSANAPQPLIPTYNVEFASMSLILVGCILVIVATWNFFRRCRRIDTNSLTSFPGRWVLVVVAVILLLVLLYFFHYTIQKLFF